MSIPTQRIAKPLIVSLLAMSAMIAVWLALSTRLHDALTWFALIAAVDIALLERWTRNSAHTTPAWIAPVATALCCLLSLWLITALSVSYSGGFGFNDSARQMGPGLFRLLLLLRLSPLDWLLLSAAPFLAFLLAGAGPVSGHHRSP